MSLDSLYFEREIEAAEKVISQMQFDLKKDAEHVPQWVIDRRYNEIAAFITLTEAARTFTQQHTEAVKYEFNRGKERGRREAEIEYVLPERYSEHPETLRDLSKQRAIEAQPELFKTDYQTKIFDEQI